MSAYDPTPIVAAGAFVGALGARSRGLPVFGELATDKSANPKPQQPTAKGTPEEGADTTALLRVAILA